VGRKLTIDFNNVVAGKYSISITNVLGQKVSESTITHTGENGTHIINVDGSIGKGDYNVVIRDVNKKEQVLKLIINDL